MINFDHYKSTWYILFEIYRGRKFLIATIQSFYLNFNLCFTKPHTIFFVAITVFNPTIHNANNQNNMRCRLIHLPLDQCVRYIRVTLVVLFNTTYYYCSTNLFHCVFKYQHGHTLLVRNRCINYVINIRYRLFQ